MAINRARIIQLSLIDVNFNSETHGRGKRFQQHALSPRVISNVMFVIILTRVTLWYWIYMRVGKFWKEGGKKKRRTKKQGKKEEEEERKKKEVTFTTWLITIVTKLKVDGPFVKDQVVDWRANCANTMKFIGSLLGISSPKRMGKEYMKVGRNALFGVRTSQHDGLYTDKVPRPLSFLVSKNGKLKHGKRRYYLILIYVKLHVPVTRYSDEITRVCSTAKVN